MPPLRLLLPSVLAQALVSLEQAQTIWKSVSRGLAAGTVQGETRPPLRVCGCGVGGREAAAKVFRVSVDRCCREPSDMPAGHSAGHWLNRHVKASLTCCAVWWGRWTFNTQLNQLGQITNVMSTRKTRRGARQRKVGVLPAPGAGGLLNETLFLRKVRCQGLLLPG